MTGLFAFVALVGVLAAVGFFLSARAAKAELAARAGYDPRAAVTLWQKMGQAGGSAPPQFLSTHPAPQNRQSDLTSYAAKVMPLYEAARKR